MTPYIDSTSHLLRSTYLRLHRVANRALRAAGVTADQYVVMRVLGEKDGISQQELTGICASDPTTVGRMLELLEQKGFVERRSLDADRRTRLVFLTAEGQRTTRRLYEAAKAACDPLDSALSPSNRESLRRSLRQLSKAFQEMETKLDDSEM